MEDKSGTLLKGAINLFMRVGIKSVSMDDIAKELHVSKKTLYQHFRNKDELVKEMLDFYLENDHSEYVASQLTEQSNVIDELLMVSKWLTDTFRNMSPAHIFDLKKYYTAQYQEFWNKKHAQILESVKNNLERGIAQGLYRGEIDVELVATIYAKNLGTFNLEEHNTLSKYKIEVVYKTIFENHIRAISNARGIEYFESRISEFLQLT
jgi:AcrR family transcriptional regulator